MEGTCIIEVQFFYPFSQLIDPLALGYNRGYNKTFRGDVCRRHVGFAVT